MEKPGQVGFDDAPVEIGTLHAGDDQFMVHLFRHFGDGLHAVDGIDQGLPDGDAFREYVDAHVTAVAIHLQRVHAGEDLFRRNDADLQVLVVISQGLAVPVRVGQPSLAKNAAQGIGEILEPHEDVAEFGIQAHDGVALIKKRAVFGGLEPLVHVLGHEYAVRRVPVDVIAPGLVRLRFDGRSNPRHGVQRLGQTRFEEVPHGKEIGPEIQFVAVASGPHDHEVRVQLPVHPQRLDHPVYGGAARFGHGRGQGTEFEPGVPKEIGNHRDQPHARILLQLLVKVGVVFVDLVGIVGLDPTQPVFRQFAGDGEALFDGIRIHVCFVKPDL